MRPVVIVSNDVANTHSPIVSIIPLTTNLARVDIPTQTILHSRFLRCPSMALCEQITTIDKSRLKERMHEYLEPVAEVSNSGYMIYYPRWTYTDENGKIAEVTADMVDIKQVLLDYGNRYIRAARFCFDNLRYRYAMQDWTHFSIEMSSGIISPLGEHGAYTQLYVVEDEYTSRRAAKHAMHQEDNFNFQNVCRELFAQC